MAAQESGADAKRRSLPKLIARKRPLEFRGSEAASRQCVLPTPKRHSKCSYRNDRFQSAAAAHAVNLSTSANMRRAFAYSPLGFGFDVKLSMG